MQKNVYELAQEYSYEVFRNVFHALDYYANKISSNKQLFNIFEYYNYFNSRDMKALEQLKYQIIIQLEIFKC